MAFSCHGIMILLFILSFSPTNNLPTGFPTKTAGGDSPPAGKMRDADLPSSVKSGSTHFEPVFREQRLLIGARRRKRRQMEWSDCKCDITSIENRLRGSNRLPQLGANRSYSYVDSRALSLVGGKYASFGANLTIKRQEGVPFKEVFLNSWESQPELRDPRDLANLWGVAVSLCTMNAERVSIYELLRTPSVARYLKRFHWDKTELKHRFLETLGPSGSLDNLCDLWNENHGDEIGKVLLHCLQALSLTGFDEKRQQFAAFWVSPGKKLPHAVLLKPEEHNWVNFLRESEISFTMAVMVEDCLGAKFARRKCGVRDGGSALHTSICVNEDVDPCGKLRLYEPPLEASQKWAWQWDVSRLDPGVRFSICSQGRLKTIQVLTKSRILLEWDLVWRDVLREYVGIQRRARLGHWEYTELIEVRERPIPVYLLSSSGG